MIKINVLTRWLVVCITCMMSSAALAHESSSFAITNASLQGLLHWLFAHQGLIILCAISLLGILFKVSAKQKNNANQ